MAFGSTTLPVAPRLRACELVAFDAASYCAAIALRLMWFAAIAWASCAIPCHGEIGPWFVGSGVTDRWRSASASAC
ncbi:hypothetical protein [Novosphingobium sp.]|uniref:hypothetical protein n=1 Tax=Novosphingobium sp. TaxID=1874826 RepID=UPI003D12D855